MPIEIVDMGSASASDNIRAALVGEEKVGKSRLAATGRKPVLFLDWDQRREAVAGIPGVYAVTFKDKFYPNMPDAAALGLDAMSSLERSLDLADFEITGPDGQKYSLNPKPPKGTIIKTLVYDSMASMGEAFRNYSMANNKDLRREIAIGKTKSYFVAGWDTWNAETSQVVPYIMRGFGLPGVDVIAIFHEAKEQAEDSTEKDPKYTGRITVFPVRYKVLLKYFSEVWRIKLAQKAITEGGRTEYRYVPRIYPQPDFSFNCSSAMLLDSEEEPNIEQIIQKHLLRKQKASSLPAIEGPKVNQLR
jgi:AAA domain